MKNDMSKSLWRRLAPILLVAGLGIVLLYQIPAIKSRIEWRLDAAGIYLKRVVNPIGAVPTAAVEIQLSPTVTATATPVVTPMAGDRVTSVTLLPTATATATPCPTPTPTPLPASVSLPAPTWEKQGWNNCGPAALTLNLRFYGWDGDQYTISSLVKPQLDDRNVNVDELVGFVWNHVPGLNGDYRVGGDAEMLKALLAAGMPVMIEEGMDLDKAYWPGDDQWAGHYLLLTGYDDAAGIFVGQDTFYGPDQAISFQELDRHWKAFNRVYITIYPAENEDIVRDILGPQWDYDYNRQHALEVAEQEIEADPEDAFAWFNRGSNLVYFKEYEEAGQVYDQVRVLGMPQRMWRYQFGPFIAYFQTNRIDDLMTLVDYALEITEHSEEALLWRGWGFYRQGEIDRAIADFKAALQVNPSYADAQYALGFLGVSP